MIQKTFHTIWVGDKPFPEEYKKYLNSWKKHHPDWRFLFWTDRNMPVKKFKNRKLYQSLTIPSCKKDIAMYELLYLYGGVYIDADFECFKNIEPLTKNKDAFGCGENSLVISAGIIGFKRRHPLLKRIMGNFKKHMAKYPNEPPNVTTGPIFLTETIGINSIPMIPTELLYPYGYYEQHRKGEVFPNAYAAHHWGGSWLKTEKLDKKGNIGVLEHNINSKEAERIKNCKPQVIPKIIHQVWYGDDPIPEQYRYYQQTWKNKHPDWNFKLWTPDNLFQLRNQRWLDIEDSHAGRSDIIRYEVLYKYGGVYVDMDMECYKSINEILNGVECFVTYEQGGFVVPTVMGSVPRHPLINKVIKGIPKSIVNNVDSNDISSRTGPKYISRILNYNDKRLTIYPKHYFYPTLYFVKDNMSKRFPDSYAVHHWNGRTKGGWYYNLINGED